MVEPTAGERIYTEQVHVAAQQRSEEELRQSEQRYRYMFEANPLPMWIRDEETLRILAVNDAALRTYGYSREELLSLNAADLHAPEETERFLKATRAGDPGQPTGHWRHRRKDGSTMEVETATHPFQLDGRSALLTLANDITERKRADRRRSLETAVTLLLAYARSTEEAMPEVIRSMCESLGCAYGARWIVDNKEGVMRCAESWCVPDPAVEEFRRVSVSQHEPAGEAGGVIRQVWATGVPVWLADVAQDSTLRRREAALKACLHSTFAFPILVGGEFFGVMEFFSRQARPRDDEVLETARTVGSHIGQFIGRKQAENNLQFFASHDPLTGLFNRTMFNERLQQALAQAIRFERSLAVLFIDLDRFKVINDTLGHNAGDLLLVELTARLRASLREGDVIGRMGGDEFVVLIEGFTEPLDLAEVAKKLIETLSRPFLLYGQEHQVTASIGISTYPQDGKDAQTLLKNADIAMYRVKEEGKNNFRFYAPQMNVHLVERLSLESNLRQAMERGELLLLYQPKVGIRDGQVMGVEALVRWQHPSQGMISPGEFVPIAEDTGLIAAIGEWILRTACEQARTWQQQGLPWLRMGVNLSPRQFAQESLLQTVREALHGAGIDPSRLELEITESMVLRNPERAARVLAQLKELGVRLTLDDFGTGYSSLGYLMRCPVHGVKIDRSFVLGLPRDPESAAVARAVIAMAHSLKLHVTAEGVETREQWDFLRELECDEMQGNYFSAPVASDIVASILRQPVTAGQRASVQTLRP
jgi:diguanylate cyclase (GGDEF)-like protein/PAS domain S-box-containing protein